MVESGPNIPMRIDLKREVYIDPDFNCRGEIDPLSVGVLAASMQAQGLLQPILVAPREGSPGIWQVVAGHRRVAAARLLNWTMIDAFCLQGAGRRATKEERLKANLVENMGRKDLVPSQEMRAIVAIYGEAPDVAQVASELGMSRKWVQKRLRLHGMEDRILGKVDEGLLGALDLDYIAAVPAGDRWSLAAMLIEKKAQGASSKAVARELKLRSKSRGKREIRRAVVALDELGVRPHWMIALSWAAGDYSTEDLFEGVALDKLQAYGIVE